MSFSSVDDVMLRQTWLFYHLPPTSHEVRTQLTEKRAARALQSVGDNTTYVSWIPANEIVTTGQHSIWHLKSFTSEDETLAAEVVAFFDDRICFVRGKANWYKAAVRWIGCDDHRCQWSQTEMTLMVSQFLQNSFREKDSQVTSLVFQVPAHLADCGLDTFCKSVEESRTLGGDGFPVIQALQNFVRHDFNMNLQSFLLTKFTTPHVSINHDGRVQPFKNVSVVLNVLKEILAGRHRGVMDDY